MGRGDEAAGEEGVRLIEESPIQVPLWCWIASDLIWIPEPSPQSLYAFRCLVSSVFMGNRKG